MSFCLKEDAILFIRSIAEKLLSKTDRYKALRVLQKLPSLVPDISSSVANLFFIHVVSELNALIILNQQLKSLFISNQTTFTYENIGQVVKE